jgi:hypothetical protein
MPYLGYVFQTRNLHYGFSTLHHKLVLFEGGNQGLKAIRAVLIIYDNKSFQFQTVGYYLKIVLKRGLGRIVVGYEK